MSQYEELFEKKSVWKSIISMAIPSVITILVMILYNMADMFFIGQLGDTRQVAAISIVGPIFSIAGAIATMLGAGGSAMIAKSLGEGEKDLAKTYASLCFYGAIVLGIIVTIFVLLLRVPLLGFLGATDETRSFATTYMSICACGVPLMLLSTTLASIIRSEGAIIAGVVGNMIATVVNMILDPIFILGMKMGVGGAALATVLGNLVGCIYFVIYIKRKAQILNYSPSLALKKPLALFHIIALGMPNALGSLLSGLASSFANQLLALYGTNAIAAMAAASKTTMLITLIQMGICMGVQPLMAYNYGAKNIPRLKETVKDLSILTCGMGLVCGVACYLGRNAIIGMFLKDAVAAEMGTNLVIYLVLASPIVGIFYLATNFLQSAGNVVFATIVSVLRQGVLLIAFLYLFHAIFGFLGIAIAHMAADVVSVVISFILLCIQFHRLERERTVEVQKAEESIVLDS